MNQRHLFSFALVAALAIILGLNILPARALPANPAPGLDAPNTD